MIPAKRKLDLPIVRRQTVPLSLVGMFCLSLALPAGSTNVSPLQSDVAVTPEQAAFFESKIRPVLIENCLGCHGEKTQIAGVRLDSRTAILGKVDSGFVVVPGKPDESLLIKVIRYIGPIKMPKAKKLPANQIADLEAWVEMGAPWPKNALAVNSTQNTPALWSLRPVGKPAVPRVAGDNWSKTDIDPFILKGLRGAGLAPTHAADKRTLIRRLSFDLIGLPPSFEEVAAFVADKAPNAYEKLVDRYLASPRYGERWARHWLDVARYADTKGYVFEEDRNYPNAYTYRNWVIDALNEDLPYNKFIEQQLAADLLPGALDADDRRSLAAMGFLTVGRRFLNQTPDIIDDRIDVTTRGFMGFTVACARCHDHKFDPVPTQDYYSLYSIFNSTKEEEIPTSPKAIREPWERQQARLAQASRSERMLVSEQVKALRKRENLSPEVKGVLQGLREEVVPVGEPLVKLKKAFDPEARARHTELESEISKLAKEMPAPPEFAMAVVEGNPHDIRVFKRGNPGNPGELAPRRFLAALTPTGKDRELWQKGSGRLELAKAIASPDNPLTSRVIVNRVWMHHFGQGLVRTPSDFGFQGEKPSHPELLDFLAGRFVKDGWSLKKLHKLIVTSATYRQSSVGTSKHYSKDPDNRLLGRMNRRRLGLEEMRDAVVAVSGDLDVSKVGGKSVDLWSQPFTSRRAVYGFVERQNLPGVFRTFDFASPDTTNPKRFQTTVPQQALFFLNSPFAIKHSHKITSRKEVVQSGEPKSKVQNLYRLVLGRSPLETEIAAAADYLALPPPSALLPNWEYGIGAVEGDRVTGFRPLGFFAGDHYRVSRSFPDPNLGFALLNGAGGHPGSDDRTAVIRRFRVPNEGTYDILGDINHPEKQGNGIRASIISSRSGLIARWTVFSRTEMVRLKGLKLERGEILDFVADPNGTDSFDAFAWSPVIVHVESRSRWEASRDFGGSTKMPKPTRSAMLAQILLMSNEFLFID
jgi:mono/diheme cytochrome c family protein